MANRTVSVELLGKGQSLVGTFKQASEGAKGLKGELEDLGQKSPKKFNDIAMAAGGVGVALLGIAGYAVHAAMAFDKQMSEVSAVSNATGKDLAALRQAALDAGKETQYSATEAAKAEAELAKAGVSTSDIMGGALKGSLALAAAGQMDLADSATIAAQTMNIFELHGRNVSHIADVLASAANVSAADMHGLGLGLQQVGLVAHQAGWSLEETVGILAAFADRGLQGSDGATSLKTAIQRLTTPTDQAKGAMHDLGIEVYDTNGHVKSAAAIAGVLKEKLGALSESERNAAMNTIFGSDAIRAANVLYGLGADGVQKYTAAVDKNGSAAETARKKTDNLAGDIERLKGSIETLAISSGSGANGGLRLLVQGVDAVVGAFLALPGPVQTGITVLAGVGGAGLVAVSALMKIKQTSTDAMDALRSMGAAGQSVASGLGAVGRMAGPIGLALGAVLLLNAAIDSMKVHWKPVQVDVDKLNDSLKFFNETGHMSGEILRITGGSWDSFAKRVAGANFELRHIQDVQKGASQADWATPAEGLLRYQAALQSFGQQTEHLNKVGQSLAEMYKSGDVTGAAAAYNQVTAALREQGVPADMINRAMKDYIDLSGGLTASQHSAAAGAESAALSQSLLNSTMADGIDKVGSLTKVFDELNGRFLGFREAEIAAETAAKNFKDAILASHGSLDQHTESGRAAETNLIALAKATEQATQKAYEEAIAKGDEAGAVAHANEVYQSHRKQLVDTLVQSGMTRQAAEALADQYARMPPLVSTRIELPGIDAAREKVSNLQSHFDAMNGRTVQTYVVTNLQTNETRNVVHPITPASRWGGAYEHAAVGKLREAGVYSPADPGRYMIAEPQTGGEAFVPKRGNYGRSMQILDRAASWYGASVVAGRGGSDGAGAVINLTVNAGMGTDGRQVGQQIVEALRPFVQSRGNNVQMAIVGRQVS